jgi:hypothetical protein
MLPRTARQNRNSNALVVGTADQWCAIERQCLRHFAQHHNVVMQRGGHEHKWPGCFTPNLMSFFFQLDAHHAEQ